MIEKFRAFGVVRGLKSFRPFEFALIREIRVKVLRLRVFVVKFFWQNNMAHIHEKIDFTVAFLFAHRLTLAEGAD